MRVRNDHGDELTYHGGPLDGQPLDVMAPAGPHDDGYEVRTEDGRILGAWWKRTAEEIVRALAAAEPIEHADEDDYHWCVLCRAKLPVRLIDHAEDCVWRQAAEWVQQFDGQADG